jgi:hypothetical protein
MTTIDKGALIDISGIGWGVIARCALWENGVICNSLHLNVFQCIWNCIHIQLVQFNYNFLIITNVQLYFNYQCDIIQVSLIHQNLTNGTTGIFEWFPHQLWLFILYGFSLWYVT